MEAETAVCPFPTNVELTPYENFGHSVSAVSNHIAAIEETTWLPDRLYAKTNQFRQSMIPKDLNKKMTIPEHVTQIRPKSSQIFMDIIFVKYEF